MSLVHSGDEYNTAEVVELLGVGRSTVYRAIERQRLEARAGLAETTTRHRHQAVPTLSGTPAPSANGSLVRAPLAVPLRWRFPLQVLLRSSLAAAHPAQLL
jgi:hypothetical protein